MSYHALTKNRVGFSPLARSAGRTRELYMQAVALGLQLTTISGRLTLRKGDEVVASGKSETIAAAINRHRLSVRRYQE